jgi:hypothetical protein
MIIISKYGLLLTLFNICSHSKVAYKYWDASFYGFFCTQSKSKKISFLFVYYLTACSIICIIFCCA